MNARLRRKPAVAVLAALVLPVLLTACGGGKDSRGNEDGNVKRPKPGSSVSGAPHDAAVPAKPTKKPRGVPGAPQNVPMPWRR